jgi:hypothetical protein
MRRPKLFGFLYTHNPFYLIGTAAMLYGLRLMNADGEAFDAQSIVLPGILASLMLVMALVAIAIIRLGGVWEDARTIVLSILLIAVSVVTSCDSIIRSSPQTVTVILLGGFLFSVAIWEMLIRSLRVYFPKQLRFPFYLILSLIFFYSLLFGPAEAWLPGLDKIPPNWRLYAFGWVLGICMLTCLPAIRATRHTFRRNGTPWSWPAYPWSIFVAVVGVACMRLYFMTLAFVPELGWINPIGLHFYLPVIFAAGVLVFETIQVESKADSSGVAGFGLFSASMILASLPVANNEMYVQFFGELTTTLASPLWITLMMLSFYASVLWLRGKGDMEWVVTGIFLVAGFASPDKTAPTLVGATIWPLIVVAVLTNVMAFKHRSINRLLTAAALTSVLAGLITGFSASSETLPFLVGSQVLLSYSLALGLILGSQLAVWLRLASIGLMLVFSLMAVAAAWLNQITGLVAASYILLLQAVAVAAWMNCRWPLFIRTPLVLLPLVGMAMAADHAKLFTTTLSNQSSLLLSAAGVCFCIGFLISCFKAGWLVPIGNDWNRLLEDIQVELKI